MAPEQGAKSVSASTCGPLGAALPKHLEWEKYLSEEDESCAERLHLKPKERGMTIVPANETLKAFSTTKDMVRSSVEDV